ncbi:RmlC-like cupin [Amylocystis lapponica]|nr:RmlC-like cupin [Amylocystis lapponica]
MLSSYILSLAMGAAGALAQTSDLISNLKLASSAVERVSLLSDEQFTFDFFNPPTGAIVPGAGGHLALASVTTFPALVAEHIAMVVGFLGPCGLNTPHTHPRATELLFLVNGSLTSGMVTETGSRFITDTLSPGQAMVLPMGSIHFQQNNGCEPLMFVSALNNEDPGSNLVGQSFFGLPADIVGATLGDIGVEDVASLATMIPDDVALGSSECLQRCGITRGTQPTAEQVPRTSGNSLPAASATATHYSRKVQSTSADVLGAVAGPAGAGSTKAATQPVTIALIVVVSVMGLGYLVLGGLFLMGRWRGGSGKGRSFVRPDMSGRTLVPTLEKYDVIESRSRS